MARNDIILLDGAAGTNLWAKAGNTAPVWQYNITNPGIVAELEEEYVQAGSQIILSNTFAANASSLKNTGYDVTDVVSRALSIAQETVAGRAKIGLDVGPLNELLEPYGDLTEDEAFEIFDQQISAGADKADLIFLETFMDLAMMKIAVQAAQKHDKPIMCSFSFDQTGHTMMGNTVDAILKGLSEYNIAAIGLNCSLGPDLAVPVIRQFRSLTDLPLIFKPNAGKPVAGTDNAEIDVETFAQDCLPAIECGIKYLGGCCGTSPAYIKRLAEKLA